MKKHLFTIVLVTVFYSLHSQNKSRDEVLQLIAEDTCECISKKNISQSANIKEKEMALGVCLIQSYGVRKKESKVFKKSTPDFEVLGEEVGILMVSTCGDEFMALFSTDEWADFSEDGEDQIQRFTKPLLLDAELQSLHNDVISSIVMKDEFEKLHTFLILEEFEGVELLKKSNFGKTFTITFEERNIYDISEKRYEIKKIVTAVELY